MTTQVTVSELFKRLDALKVELQALRDYAGTFSNIAQALINPFEWRIGNTGVSGYGKNVAKPSLPDVGNLSERINAVHREHFDLLAKGSRLLDGTAKQSLVAELEKMFRP